MIAELSIQVTYIIGGREVEGLYRPFFMMQCAQVSRNTIGKKIVLTYLLSFHLNLVRINFIQFQNFWILICESCKGKK